MLITIWYLRNLSLLHLFSQVKLLASWKSIHWNTYQQYCTCIWHTHEYMIHRKLHRGFTQLHARVYLSIHFSQWKFYHESWGNHIPLSSSTFRGKLCLYTSTQFLPINFSPQIYSASRKMKHYHKSRSVTSITQFKQNNKNLSIIFFHRGP